MRVAHSAHDSEGEGPPHSVTSKQGYQSISKLGNGDPVVTGQDSLLRPVQDRSDSFTASGPFDKLQNPTACVERAPFALGPHFLPISSKQPQAPMHGHKAGKKDTELKVWDIGKLPTYGEIRMKQEREGMGTRIG